MDSLLFAINAVAPIVLMVGIGFMLKKGGVPQVGDGKSAQPSGIPRIAAGQSVFEYLQGREFIRF